MADERDPRIVEVWRQVATAGDLGDRREAFQIGALGIGLLVDDGEIERADAADELIELAEAHRLFDRTDAEHVVAQAFIGVRALGWTQAPPPQEERRTNGHDARAERQQPGRPKVEPPQFLDRRSFIEGFVPPDYLIDGIIQRRFIYALTGQTGHAKTAVALLISELVACEDANAMLGRHRVQKGRVVYFVGENPDDVRMRIIGGDSERSDDPMRDDIYFVPGQFNITEMHGFLVERFNHIGGVNLIVVDTSAAYFLGRDEIDNVAMGAHARMLRTLTQLPGGPAVLALCHPIKRVENADQLLPRGGGAFLGEIDGNLTLYMATADTVELSHHGKLRGPGFQPITFKVETILTTKLVDAGGRPIPTVRAVAMTAAQEQAQAMEFNRDRESVLVALLQYPDHSLGQLAEELNWFQGGRNGEASATPNKMKVSRAIEYIEKKAHPKLISRNMDKPLLTKEGIEAAQKIHGRRMRAVDDAAQGNLL